MAEIRVGLGVLIQCDEIGLDADLAMDGMAEQIVLMAGLGTAPVDLDPGARLHERTVTAFLGLPEKPADRDIERRFVPAVST